MTGNKSRPHAAAEPIMGASSMYQRESRASGHESRRHTPMHAYACIWQRHCYHIHPYAKHPISQYSMHASLWIASAFISWFDGNLLTESRGPWPAVDKPIGRPEHHCHLVSFKRV